MNRSVVAVIPAFPAQEIRNATREGDWSRAAELVAGHDQAVRSAFVDPLDDNARAYWVAMVREQQALMLELQREREQAGAELRRIEHERRGAHLYLAQKALGDVEA